jgi:hypothetical protein
MAAIRRPDRERFWRDKFLRFEQSGMSLRAFSKQEGINWYTFKSWIFIIKGRDGEEARKQLKAKSKSGNFLDPVEKARRQLEQLAVVEKWKQSGLSQVEFCHKEGLRQQQLSMWKLQTAKLDIDELRRIVAPVPECDWTKRNFVALNVVEPAKTQRKSNGTTQRPVAADPITSNAQSNVVAKLCCGDVVVLVLEGADVGTLRALLVALKESAS